MPKADERLWPGLVALGALAAATRVPLAGVSLGEADSARYLIGLEQWVRAGRHAHFAYGHEFSPGYYAAALWLVHTLRATPVVVLDGISLVAALVAAPLLYLVGRQVARPAAALVGAVLFLLAPAYWWLGIEPHPQQAAFLFLLLAMAWVLPAASWWRILAAAICFGLGMLCKNDLILLGGIFPALAWRGNAGRQNAGQEEGRRRWRRTLASLAVPLGGAAIFLAGRSLLGQGWQQAQGDSLHAVGLFLEVPHGVEALKQILPLAFAGGLATLALIVAGLALGLRRPEWRQRWGWLLAASTLPGLLFWLMLRGNNARHMAPYLLLPLLAACEGVFRWPRLRTAAGTAMLAAAVVGANWLMVPPNSNLSLYPGGDVYASAHYLAARTRALVAWQIATGTNCILGNSTLPYLEWAALARDPADVVEQPVGLVVEDTLYAAQIGGLRFVEVNSRAEFEAAAAQCGPYAASVEYSRRGVHRRFLGAEWTWLPLARRFYH